MTETVDPGQIARDWITIWQSELAALASDREAQEAWQALVSLWAGAAGAMLPRAGADDGAGGRTGPAEAPRASAPAAAPDARDAEIERLSRRVAELEGRLAALERRGRGRGRAAGGG